MERETRAYAEERPETLYEALNSASNQIDRAEQIVGEIEERLRGPVPHDVIKGGRPEELPAPYVGIRRHAASLAPSLMTLSERLETILKAL